MLPLAVVAFAATGLKSKDVLAYMAAWPLLE